MVFFSHTITPHSKPNFFNTYQGSKFTSDMLNNVLSDNGIKMSMDGRGRALDIFFVERLGGGPTSKV